MSPDRFLKPAGWVALAMAILSPVSAFGYEFRLVPYLSLTEGYNSNVFFTEKDRTDSWIATFAPGLDVSERTERLDAGLGGNLLRWQYSGASSLNTTDWDVRGRAAYRFTTEFRLSATGDYRRESNPDRHFEATGLVDRSTDYRQDYTIAAEYAMSEKAATTLSYAYEKLDYGTIPFRNSSSQSADMGFAYNLSQFATETKALANVGYAQGVYEGLKVSNYTLTIGVFRAVRELWSAHLDVGGRYTVSQFDVLGERLEKKDRGWVADASVIYTGERTRANVTFSSNIAPAYGFAGAVQRTAAVVSLDRRFLYELSGTLSAGYYWNKSKEGQYSFQTIDEQSTQLRPGIRWEATKNIVVDAAYQFTWLRNELTGGSSVQNYAFANATLSYPFFDE